MNKAHIALILLPILLIAACDTSKQERLSSSSQQLTNTPFGDEANVEFLPLEEAFQFSSKVVDENTLLLRWNIAEGYHLYKDKFNFAPINQSVSIQGLDFPVGEILNDLNFGKIEMYKHQLEIQVKLTSKETGGPKILNIRYQGCAEGGLCYPPVSIRIKVL